MGYFFELNRRFCVAFNQLLPVHLNVDGNAFFLRKMVPEILRSDIKMYDIGGGSLPCISESEKVRHRIELVGFDISQDELDAAPPGLYDEKIVADLTRYRGRADADVIVCQSVLEHVQDNENSVAALATFLKPGGEIHIFVPCRNALFARLNLALPQSFKMRLLEYMHPGSGEHMGFPVRYDKCTPKKLGALLEKNGFEIVNRKLFWKSAYFNSFIPAFLFWRLWQVVLYVFIQKEAAETFVLVARKIK